MKHLVAWLIVASSLCAPSASAHVRLMTSSNGMPLRWLTPTNISIVINSTGPDDLINSSTAGTHLPALQSAVRSWNELDGTNLALVEITSSAQRARTDWESNNVHLVWFDESNTSGYFPLGSGTVAVTPVYFMASGLISDADVLFNGLGFEFTTSQELARFDVEDVAAHELGHLLGLDHSGWAGATMYPYVDPSIILHRSLALDEASGMRDAYPDTTFGSISGTVRRSNDSPVSGAHVVARDASNRPCAGTLTNAMGAFQLEGLDAGSYSVYATPLDAPVSDTNLGSGQTIQTDFEATLLGAYVVPQGQAVLAGNLTVDAQGTVSLGDVFDEFPAACTRGSTRSVILHGMGLLTGSTLSASDATIVITPIAWSGGQVHFSVTIPSDAALGHVDLSVTSLSGEKDILTAPLEIVPASPLVASVTPDIGSLTGGAVLTIQGTGFRAGARVMIGDQVYFDGAAAGATVVDDTQITLTTHASAVGVHDVVVVDASGVEGRAVGAFEVGYVPAIASVFPLVGSAAGGTSVVLRGSDFVDGSIVRIDGVVQSNVTVTNSTRLVVVTTPGLPGAQILEVESPAGAVASAAFSYTLGADPMITSLTPDAGPSAGGQTVQISGANFSAASEVYFGADPDTGVGGVLASSITWIDADTLEVVTPKHAGGAQSVMVLDPASNQAAVLASGYSFDSPSSGGGGGCSIASPLPPAGPWEGLRTFLPVLAVLAWLAWRARPTQVLARQRVDD